MQHKVEIFPENPDLIRVSRALPSVSWRIVLLRHGQSEGNVDHLLYTSSLAIFLTDLVMEDPLTDRENCFRYLEVGD